MTANTAPVGLWHRTDVLVVGSGIAGSSAAVQAARAGATVTLIEKSGDFGGSTALSAGMFWTAPSVEAYRRRIPLGNVALGEAVVGDFEEALQELRHTGIRVADEPMRDIMTFGIGYSTAIQDYLQWARNTVQGHGGAVLPGHRLLSLVTDDDGRVTGARIRTPQGTTVRVEAGAVVLATGGFQGDPGTLSAHVANADRLVLRSNPGSVGDGLRAAQASGAGEHRGDGNLLRTPASLAARAV